MEKTTLKLTHTWDVDWSGVARGTPVVLYGLGSRAEDFFEKREDGLLNAVFWRVKTEKDGNHISKTAYFRPNVDVAKERWAMYCALADDTEGVRGLAAYKAAENAEREEYERQRKAEREARNAEAQARYEQRRVELEAAAVKLGCDVQELRTSRERWDALTRYGLSRRTDHCAWCGRGLIDERSVERGIGPDCIQYLEKVDNIVNQKKWEWLEYCSSTIIAIHNEAKEGRRNQSVILLCERLDKSGLTALAGYLRGETEVVA